MAFPLSLANFLVALQWFIYGYQLKDHFIQVDLFVIRVYGYDVQQFMHILYFMALFY